MVSAFVLLASPIHEQLVETGAGTSECAAAWGNFGATLGVPDRVRTFLSERANLRLDQWAAEQEGAE